MKLKLTLAVLLIILLSGNFLSCKKEGVDDNLKTANLDLPATPYQYSSSVSVNKRATLGRVLFYDNHLSVSNSISCASCHKQALGFSDNVAFSRGFENRLTLRNSLPIQDLTISSAPSNLFWDGREQFLSNMVLKPIMNHVEMGLNDMNAIVERVKNAPYYRDLFISAYGNSEVNIDKIADALSMFTGSISSENSKFAMYQNGIAQLSGLEQSGMFLFFNKYNCGGCHELSGFGYNRFATFVNIGLDINYADNGLGAMTKNSADNGKFKTPNLRNVALTAPYMHDGRFNTLSEVLDHYSHTIANHPNLDPQLEDAAGNPIRMNITEQDKNALIAFLNTMTSFSMITDPKFSNPFKAR